MAEKRGLYCSKTGGTLDRYEGMVEATFKDGSRNDKFFIDDILCASCCVSDVYEPELGQQARCDLLYYLVGAIIYDKIQDEGELGRIISTLSLLLGPLFNMPRCRIEENKSGAMLFPEMRKLGSYTLEPGMVWDRQGNSRKVNCEKYKKYLQGIADAYKAVQASCGNPGSNENCGEVSKGYRENTPQDLYDAMYNSMEPAKPTRTIICSDKLPSARVYCELNEADYECSNGSTNSVKSNLGRNPNTQIYAEQIVEGWCHAPKINNDALRSEQRCNFLYYWVGNILLSGLSNPNNFSSAMNEVYGELGKLGINNECTNMHRNISKEEFLQMKAIFDYTNDHNTMQTHLQSSGESCDKIYADRVKNVASACSAVIVHCNGSGKDSDPYCADFNDKYKDYCNSKLSELRCTAAHATATPGGSAASSAVAPAVSAAGGLAAIGIPTVFFFLYKHTSLFSGLRNSFSGGSNRKKRTTIESAFDDTLTEDTLTTDSSTEYSTLGSTIGSTDEFTVYSGSAFGRRGANNNRQRRNLSYGRM